MQGCQKCYHDGGMPEFLRECLFFLEKIEWVCQISWGAKYRVTPGRGSKQQLATSSLFGASQCTGFSSNLSFEYQK